jgi:hypothetical protein
MGHRTTAAAVIAAVLGTGVAIGSGSMLPLSAALVAGSAVTIGVRRLLQVRAYGTLSGALLVLFVGITIVVGPVVNGPDSLGRVLEAVSADRSGLRLLALAVGGFLVHESLVRIDHVLGAGGTEEAGRHRFWSVPTAGVLTVMAALRDAGLEGAGRYIPAGVLLIAASLHSLLVFAGVAGAVHGLLLSASVAAVVGLCTVVGGLGSFDGSGRGSLLDPILAGTNTGGAKRVSEPTSPRPDGGNAGSGEHSPDAPGQETGRSEFGARSPSKSDTHARAGLSTDPSPTTDASEGAGVGDRSSGSTRRARARRVSGRDGERDGADRSSRRRSTSSARTRSAPEERSTPSTPDEESTSNSSTNVSPEPTHSDSNTSNTHGVESGPTVSATGSRPACLNCGSEGVSVRSRPIVPNSGRNHPATEVPLCASCHTDRQSGSSVCGNPVPVDSEGIFERNGHCCYSCDRSAAGTLELHPIVPLNGRGSPHRYNVVALCPACHSALHED